MVQAIHLPAATAQVSRAIQDRVEHDRLGSPFFVQTGAGVSYPAVPLAYDIEMMCREEIDRLGLPQPPKDAAPEIRYQQCIQLAFPDAELRRAFLSRLIQNTEPSNATWLLAHLLGLHGLSHLGLTTNFDDHISRALIHLGRRAHIIDHPSTTFRMDPRRPDIQIVHLHGTYESYDCCNTPVEIKGRAHAMQEVVLRLLHERSPLVFGYSGWKSDVFMRALLARLRKGGLPFNLRWFCYSEANAKALPSWLVRHESVQLVVPDSSRGRDTMPGEEVFEAFARHLDIPVEPVAPSTLERATADLSWGAVALSRAEALLARGNDAEAVAVLRTVPMASLHLPQRVFFDSLLETLIASTWQTIPTLTLDVARMRRSLAEDVLRGEIEDRLEWEVRRAKALHGEALALRGLGRHEEALPLFALIRDTYATQGETEMRARIARALVAEGVTLFETNREAEAHDRWGQAIRITESEAKQIPSFKEELARALFNRALAWAKVGRHEEAREAWGTLVEQLRNVNMRAVRALVDRTLRYLVPLDQRSVTTAGVNGEVVGKRAEVVHLASSKPNINVLHGKTTTAAAIIHDLAAPKELRNFVAFDQIDKASVEEHCLHDLFRVQAEHTPEAEAMVAGDQGITYADLERRANLLAHHLRSLGVGPEVRVGLMLEPSVEKVISMLAVLKAGGTCVSFDLSHSRERLAVLAHDAAVRVVVATSDTSSLLPSQPGLCQVLLDEEFAVGNWPDTPPQMDVSPENTAYVIYTSGSTGMPKGVAVTHAEILRYLRSTESTRLQPGERVAQAPDVINGDTFGIWRALLKGATLVGLPREEELSSSKFLHLDTSWAIRTGDGRLLPFDEVDFRSGNATAPNPGNAAERVHRWLGLRNALDTDYGVNGGDNLRKESAETDTMPEVLLFKVAARQTPSDAHRRRRDAPADLPRAA